MDERINLSMSDPDLVPLLIQVHVHPFYVYHFCFQQKLNTLHKDGKCSSINYRRIFWRIRH